MQHQRHPCGSMWIVLYVQAEISATRPISPLACCCMPGPRVGHPLPLGAGGLATGEGADERDVVSLL